MLIHLDFDGHNANKLKCCCEFCSLILSKFQLRRLSGTCQHVAGLMFALADIQQPSTTDVKCQWIAPAKGNNHYAPDWVYQLAGIVMTCYDRVSFVFEAKHYSIFFFRSWTQRSFGFAAKHHGTSFEVYCISECRAQARPWQSFELSNSRKFWLRNYSLCKFSSVRDTFIHSKSCPYTK